MPFGGLGMTIRLPMANNVDGSPDGVSGIRGRSAADTITFTATSISWGASLNWGATDDMANADKLVMPGPESGVAKLKDDVFWGWTATPGTGPDDIFTGPARMKALNGASRVIWCVRKHYWAEARHFVGRGGGRAHGEGNK